MTVTQLAALVDGQVVGNGALTIHGVQSLQAATAADLSFVSNRKATAVAASSNAGCLLVPSEWPDGVGRTVIRVADPRACFAKLIRVLKPERPSPPGVHPSSLVASPHLLGLRVSIGPNVVIGEGSIIGDDCVIGAGCVIGIGVQLGPAGRLHAKVTIYDEIRIGARVVLHSGVVLGADGFGFVMAGEKWEKFPQIGTVVIGDDVEVGANSCIDRAALGETVIGDGTKLDNLVHIGHNCQIGKHVVIAAQTGLSGAVCVGDFAVIGGQVGVGDKARIESKAVVGSGGGILPSKIVRAGSPVWGTPARPLKEYLEILATMNRLPEMRLLLKDLTKRMEELEQN